jgi:hypothetical protein
LGGGHLHVACVGARRVHSLPKGLGSELKSGSGEEALGTRGQTSEVQEQGIERYMLYTWAANSMGQAVPVISQISAYWRLLSPYLPGGGLSDSAGWGQ